MKQQCTIHNRSMISCIRQGVPSLYCPECDRDDAQRKPIQVNNLKIKFNKLYNKWQVITPTKINLDEFDYRINAIEYAKRTTDFIKNRRMN